MSLALTPRTTIGRERYAQYKAEMPSRIAHTSEQMRQNAINKSIQEIRNNPSKIRAARTPRNRSKRPNMEQYLAPSSINAMNVNTPNSNTKNSNNQNEKVCTRNGCFTRVKRFFGYGRKTRRARKTHQAPR